MKYHLAAAVIAISFMHIPAVSHAQDMGMSGGQMQKSNWDAVGYGTFALRGHDIIVRPEGGKYVVYRNGVRDKGYTSLSDARMRGEYLTRPKTTTKEKKMMMMKEEKKKTMTPMDSSTDLDKGMGQ